jgi:large subunit ribosomal protein L31
MIRADPAARSGESGSGRHRLVFGLTFDDNRRLTFHQASGAPKMKAEIHPEYREVVFQDVSSDFSIKTRSTIQTRDTIKWEDGNEYPLVKVEVSSKSHPFYTGQHKIVDSGGRVDRFKQRYGKSK